VHSVPEVKLELDTVSYKDETLGRLVDKRLEHNIYLRSLESEVGPGVIF
jgi:hypothetical protein